MNDINKRYRILFELASGAPGKVYVAKDLASGRYVTLKVFSAEALEDPENFGSFINEARLLSAINHPNIVSLHEVGKSGSSYFIAREFVEGESLRERISRGQLPLKETLNIAVQTAGALNAAHGAGIIHRDIKPENVILSEPNLVKVVDFDLAKIHEQRPPGTWIVNQKFIKPITQKELVYLSPEEVRGRSLNKSTDVWHLGVLISEMVSHRTPFEKETPSGTISSILRGKPARLEGVPSDLQDIVNKALQKPPAQRYASAEDIASDLKEVLDRIDRPPARSRPDFDRILDAIRKSPDTATRETGGPPGPPGPPPGGDSPDVLPRSDESQSEPLYLTAQVTEMRGENEIPRLDGFAQGQKHRVTVHLAIQERATGIVADTPSPLDRSVPHELYISFFASWLPPTPLERILMKGASAQASTGASVEFSVPANLDSVALTVVLMELIGNEVTPIQSGELTGDVIAPGATGSGIFLRIDPHPVRPPDPTTDGVTIMMGDNTLAVYGAPKTDGQFLAPGHLTDLRTELGYAVLALGTAITNAKDEKKLAESLKNIALKGNRVLELFQHRLVADAETRRRLFDTDETVRLWSRDLNTDLPVEFICDPLPDQENPALCPQFVEGLNDGACRKCENRDGAICAFDFWAFRRRIERRVTSNFDATPVNSIAKVPAKTLPSLTAPAAFGASVTVSSGSREAIIKLLTEGGVEIEPPPANWKGWRALLQKAPHRLLVLLSHTEQNAALEIGGDMVDRQLITEDYVNPQRQEPGPVVLLTGCETAQPDSTFLSFVSRFLDKGAAVVVATLALIREDASAEATQQLLNALREVVAGETNLENRTVGEIMRRTRCRMLANHDLTGLNLVAYGDADWRFGPRGEQ